MAFFSKKTIGKRERLARALTSSRLFGITNVLSANRLTIFNYHRIAKGDPALQPFDSGVYGPDEAGFRASLLAMKRHADPISENDLIASLNGGPVLPARSFMVTFDDGYRDNYERAMPILRELGIPAVFFVPTQVIEERKLGWWDHVSWYLKQTDRPSIELRGERYDLSGPLEETTTVFHEMFKQKCAMETANLLEELSQACGVPEPSKSLCDQEMMTWEQIREASRSGITIGSHTHTHRVLSRLDLATQRDEMVRSKRILEERLGLPVRSVSYPVGGYEHFNLETKDLAREAGYEVAYSFLTGVNPAGAIDRYDVRRICPDPSPSIFTGTLCLPRLFAQPVCAMKNPAPAHAN